jgi:hypothetical protein
MLDLRTSQQTLLSGAGKTVIRWFWKPKTPGSTPGHQTLIDKNGSSWFDSSVYLVGNHWINRGHPLEGSIPSVYQLV